MAVLLLASCLYVARGSEDSMGQAEKLLSSLDTSQKGSLVLPFEGEARSTWNYVPGKRLGVPLKDMKPDSKKAALDLLRSSLSESGFKKAEVIRTEVEASLRDMENNPGRDPELYYVTFFGNPARKGNWGWRFEGHHLSYNFTYMDGTLISTTPQFMGSNPAEVRQGPHKGLRVLAKEEDLARELIKSLDASQRKACVLSEQAPADLITTNQRKVAILEDKGLSYKAMSSSQKLRLQDLVHLYAEVQKPDQKKVRLDKVEKGGWDNLRFAWMGGLDPGQGHYYRIQGPTFLIEYDNTQNDANHVHTVWRDFTGDFGRDILGEHYETATDHRHSH